MKPLTGLEKEIEHALNTHPSIHVRASKQAIAEMAAEIAKKYIEKAFTDGYYASAGISEEMTHNETIEISDEVICEKLFKRWIKENGLIAEECKCGKVNKDGTCVHG